MQSGFFSLFFFFFFELLSAHIRFSPHFCITAAQVVKGHLQRLRGAVLFAEEVKEESRNRNGRTLIRVITGERSAVDIERPHPHPHFFY